MLSVTVQNDLERRHVGGVGERVHEAHRHRLHAFGAPLRHYSALRLDLTPIARGTLRLFWRSANSSLGLANNDIGAGLGSFLDPDARQSDEIPCRLIDLDYLARTQIKLRKELIVRKAT